LGSSRYVAFWEKAPPVPFLPFPPGVGLSLRRWFPGAPFKESPLTSCGVLFVTSVATRGPDVLSLVAGGWISFFGPFPDRGPLFLPPQFRLRFPATAADRSEPLHRMDLDYSLTLALRGSSPLVVFFF